MNRGRDADATPADGLPDGYEVPSDDGLDEDTNPREAVDAARAAVRDEGDRPASAAGATDADADANAVADAVPDAADAVSDAADAVSDAADAVPDDADAVQDVDADEPASAGATDDGPAEQRGPITAVVAAAGTRTARSVERVEDESVEPVDPARRRLGAWIAAGVLVLLLGGIATTIAVLANSGPTAAPTTGTAASESASSTPDGQTAATTTAPAPTPGASTAAPEPTPTETSVLAPELAPVKPDQPAKGDDGVVVELTKVESVNGEGSLPGEVSGPAIRVTVELQNASTKPLDLGAVVVNAYTGADRTPASAILEPGGAPFSGELAVGKRASGVYLFTVPVADRSDMVIGVDYRVGTSTVIFRGTIG